MPTTSRPSATTTLTIRLDGPKGQQAFGAGAADTPLGLGRLAHLPLLAFLRGEAAEVQLRQTDAPEAEPLTLSANVPAGALHFDDGRRLRAELRLNALTLTLEPSSEGIEAPDALPPSVLELAEGLPPALRAAAEAYAEADRPDASAGLLLRWAWTTPQAEGQPSCAAVRTWWGQRPAAQGRAVTGWALTQAELLIDALCDILDTAATSDGTPLPADAAEALALDRDALASTCALLYAVGEGQLALEAERTADDLLRRVFAAAAPLPPFTDPALDALARRGAGWWCAAPGAPLPPLDADAFHLDEDEERAIADLIDAFEDEAAEHAEAEHQSPPR